MKGPVKGTLAFALALLLVLAGAIVDGFRFDVGESVDAILPPPLPVAVEAPDDNLMQDIIAAYLWDSDRGKNRKQGTATNTDGPGAGMAKCKLKGIYYGQVYQPLAMFACGGQPLKAWKEGETLPNQAMVAEIQADHVVIEKGGERQNVFLFGKK